MDNKIKVSDIRAKFPMYGDMSDDQLLSAVRKKFYADIPMADFVKRIDYDTDRAKYSPASESFLGNLLPAAGAQIASIGRAVGAQPLLNRIGLDALPQSKEEAAQLDKPLDESPGSTTGRVLGGAAVLSPTAFIPGANTYAGASAIGGLTGLATTEGGLADRAEGGALGAAGGLLGNLLGRGVSAVGGAAKGLIEPFTQSGRERIAGRTIGRFATNPNAILAAQGGPTITGAVPTLAEATKDTGLATLERAIGTMSREAEDALMARAQANNAARIASLQGIAGNPATRAAAESSRDAASKWLYAASDAAIADIDDTFRGLMKRPAFASAVGEAEKLAKNNGLADLFFRDNKGKPIAVTGEGAHLIKKALDDAMERGSSFYMGDAAAKSAGKTQQAFLDWFGKYVPEYGAAKSAFAAGSQPLNQMDIGARLLDKTTAAVRDITGNPKLQANAFSKAMNDEDALVKAATGMRQSLSDVMTPGQTRMLNAIRNELETVSNLSQAANGPGSQTAKMLASQNLMRQIAGPLGIPDSWVGSALSQEFMRAPQFFVKSAEERIQQSVAKGLLTASEGQRLLGIAMRADTAPPSELALLGKALGPGLLGYAAAQQGQ